MKLLVMVAEAASTESAYIKNYVIGVDAPFSSNRDLAIDAGHIEAVVRNRAKSPDANNGDIIYDHDNIVVVLIK